jgi:hypothetical protein
MKRAGIVPMDVVVTVREPFHPRRQHAIKRVRFVNLGRLWSPGVEAIAAYPPMQSFDLAHFVNKIPVGLDKNWLVTFESALPRMFPPQRTT